MFNKSDLADPASFERVKRHFELERGIQCIFMAGDPVVQKRGGRERSESGAGGERERQRERKISASHAVNRTQLKQLHSLIQSTLGPRKFSSVPPVLLVVGFPNVGKSTLINAFRAFSKSAAGKNAGKSYLDATKEDTKRMQKGGAAKVGAEPGVTRGISGFLVSSTVSSSSANASASAGGDKGKQTDKLFLLDTPGIMLPFIPSTPQGVELGLKLSAINSIADLVIGEEALVRYTLWILNRTQQFGYVQMLHPHLAQPTSNLDQLLMAVFRAKHSRTVHKSALFREVQQRMKENEGRGVEEPINELSDSTAAAAAPSSESASSSRTGPQSIAQLTTEELHLCTSWWIKTFRRGEFGRLVLDHIPAPTKKLTTTNK